MLDWNTFRYCVVLGTSTAHSYVYTLAEEAAHAPNVDLLKYKVEDDISL